MQMLTPSDATPYRREMKILFRVGAVLLLVFLTALLIALLGITESAIPRGAAHVVGILMVIDMLTWVFLSEQKYPRHKTRDDQLVISAGRLARDQARQERKLTRGA